MTVFDLVGSLTLGAITFRDRSFPNVVSAARAAGFDRIGVTVGQCVAALERGISLDELRLRLSDAGLSIGELELIRLGDDSHVRHINSLVEDLALALEPDRVHVAAWNVEHSMVRDTFASVCERLPHLPIAFEFMPYNAIPSFAASLDLVHSVGAPNASIVLDILHFFRAGTSFDALTAEALSRVAVVQLSDVVDRGSNHKEEARYQRTYPGRGTLDSLGFLRALHAAAASPLPFSLEPISNALETLPLAIVADEAMVSTKRLLREALGA
ncbi:sugar phosphate isomerase/epimerase family protein [Lacisediminihabitans profunda]|uniref:Sugar phosphate isomerase/epimerase n=1 Tax=Lacisediminihabitans profunda TaxID=2594790 RepID=A0A5C8UJH5_9MICO|nr:sugar phosphate isomerase/epimerase [Lacisediminihabitans profunda]TXN28349.1 sugar phosphate isomerase/epimerase [Lacisediminihabitans profunda]